RRGSTRRSASPRTIRTAIRSRTRTSSGLPAARASAVEEPALERAEQLLARERPDALGASIALGDVEVVLQAVVRGAQRVVELVPLEDVVLPPRLVAPPVLRVDRAAD